MNGVASGLTMTRDLSGATTWATEALACAQALGDKEQEARALSTIGYDLVALGVIAVFPASLDEYVGTPEASAVVILTTAALLGVIGLLAGYFPARRASLLDPVVALKLA